MCLADGVGTLDWWELPVAPARTARMASLAAVSDWTQLTRSRAIQSDKANLRFGNWFGSGRCGDAKGEDGSDKRGGELHIGLRFVVLLMGDLRDKEGEGQGCSSSQGGRFIFSDRGMQIIQDREAIAIPRTYA